jgi:hypothetical protein
MPIKFFLTIVGVVRDHNLYFECKTDAIGKIGFTSYQKYSAAIRMLAYGVVGVLIDEYMCMSETTCLESRYKFSRRRVWGSSP